MDVYGEAKLQIDATGRINIPRKFQSLFEREGFLTRALNNQSLVFYSHSAWESIKKRLANADFSIVSAANVARYFSVGTEIKLDGQGRLTVPPNLRLRAGLEKEITLLAMGASIEIWDTARWMAYDNEHLTGEAVESALRELQTLPVAG